MDLKIEFPKEELRIENETQSSASQGLELQQIKKECTDDGYLNFTYEENVKVYFDVPVNNSNSDNSNIAFAEDKIYVKRENDTSKSLEIREIKSESIDGDECGQDVEFNFDVPAENNSNEIDNSQNEFAEEKIYVKKENFTSEGLVVQDIKSEFVYVKKEIDTSESLEVQAAKFGGCNRNSSEELRVEIFESESSEIVNFAMDSKIESSKEELRIENEIQSSASQGLELQQIKKECTDDEYLNFTSEENLKVYLDVPENNSNSDNSNIAFAEDNIYVKGRKSGTMDGDACGQDVEFNFDVPAENNSNEIDNSQIKFEEVNIYVKKEIDTSESLEGQEIESEFVDYDEYACGQNVEYNLDVPAVNYSNENDNSKIEFEEVKIYEKKVIDTSASLEVQDAKFGECNNKTIALKSNTHRSRVHVREDRNGRSKTALQSAAKKRVHPDAKPHICVLCNQTFKTRGYLLRHERIHNGDRPFKCTDCDKSFVHSSSLSTHERTHSGDRPYKCTVCDKSFSILSNLSTHERIHSGVRPYKCTVCHKAFVQSGALTAHKQTHSGDRPYKCNVCNKAFAFSSSLGIHKRVHTGEKPYKCTFCKKTFTQSASLAKHKRTHSGDKPYKCTVCKETFTDLSNLSTHELIHSGDRPYVCTVCNKVFSQSAAFRKHRRTHSDITPYKCPVCTKAFAQLYYLTKHERIHRNERPYKCILCNKAYKDPSSLFRHKRTHSDDRP